MNIDFVVDECVDYTVVAALKEANYKIISIAEYHNSFSDVEVLSLAVEKDAVLITEDKDFGELVFRFQLRQAGILLIRLPAITSQLKATTIIRYIDFILMS